MKKRNFKLLCAVIAICMFISATPVLAYDTSIVATPESTNGEIEITPMGIGCIFGIHGSTTTIHAYCNVYCTRWGDSQCSYNDHITVKCVDCGKVISEECKTRIYACHFTW